MKGNKLLYDISLTENSKLSVLINTNNINTGIKELTTLLTAYKNSPNNTEIPLLCSYTQSIVSQRKYSEVLTQLMNTNSTHFPTLPRKNPKTKKVMTPLNYPPSTPQTPSPVTQSLMTFPRQQQIFLSQIQSKNS